MLPGITAWLAAAVILLSPGRSKESRNSTDQTLYLGVVYSRVDPGLQRTLERALGSAPFRPLYLQLESGLGQMCTALAGRRMAGGLVFTGTGASTAVIALSAMGLPVLWVGGTAFHQEELGPTVVRVGPGLPEAARALRSLLTAWRWHSYTLLWAGPPPGQATLSQLLRHPLSPTVHHLAPPFKRVLSRVSHSGRGVIALAGGRSMVRPILEVATQLGLTDGNYVWLWLDTAGNSRLDTSAVRRARSLIRPVDRLPVGLLRLRAGLPPADRHLVRASVRLLLDAARRAASKCRTLFDWITDTDCLLLSDCRLPIGLLQLRAGLPPADRHLVRASVQLLLDAARRAASKCRTLYDWSTDTDCLLLSDCRLPVGLLRLRAGLPPADRHLVRASVRLLLDAARRAASKCRTLFDWITDTDCLLLSDCRLPGGLLRLRAGLPPADRHLVRVSVRLLLGAARRAATKCRTLYDWSTDTDCLLLSDCRLPVGLLRLRAGLPPADRHLVRASVRLLLDAARRAASKTPPDTKPASCWAPSSPSNFTIEFVKELRKGSEEAVSGGRQGNDSSGRALSSRFQILNLIPRQELQNSTSDSVQMSDNWKQVGEIVGCCDVRLERIIWPGGNIGGPCGGSRTVIKVVTAVAAPFVMISETARGIEGACMRGLPCHVVGEYNGTRYTARVSCCYGLAMDLLEAVSEELEFDFYLYMVPDSTFGTKQVDPSDKSEKWSGVVADLMNGHAHMAFTALSITRPRSDKIDFSTPFYYSGTSFLAAPNQRTDIPLLAFLLPFSPELWIAIFTSLNVTAVAVAIYEWLSPFGLNPWGRQRTKNFSMSSALWVCWGLLCGHLVAFKAPKSWPNKFLINVWGGFSVIFVASYTANIAALIAGLFFHSATASPNDHSLLSQRVAAPQGSATEYYVRRVNKLLWEHMRRIKVPDVAVGVQMLKNGSLDILIADTPILDYYRATDSGCELQKIGDAISNEDMYAVGMIKGFPLKDSISSVISKFTTNGFMDILQKKWYGELACFTIDHDMSQPRPLGVSAVAGVFLLLGLGVVVGIIILILEHLFYKYTLPILRHKPKGTIWRSRNIMFFSQKLYRFINCVELVSPHHAARELVHTIRQGQITSLFQKSVKRKEHEQRRRRKSKAQFFEMIQEIRRVQQEEKQNNVTVSEEDRSGKLSPRMKKCKSPQLLSPPTEGSRRMSRLPSRLELARRFSKDVFRSKSSGNLSLRRMSSDINFAASRFLECHSSQAIGRRLSRDTNPSPPDMNSRRESHLLTPELSIASAAELEAGPRSPFLLPPEIAVHPPPAGHRFSYVDTGNPAFRERLARFTGEQRSGSEDIEERRRNAPSLLEQITSMQEQFPNKPKVVSVLPKNRSASEITLRHDTSPLERLSREELVGLSEYPETELKRRVLDALKDKDPT